MQVARNSGPCMRTQLGPSGSVVPLQGATSKAGGIYLYANQKGCDGGRLYFDGYPHSLWLPSHVVRAPQRASGGRSTLGCCLQYPLPRIFVYRGHQSATVCLPCAKARLRRSCCMIYSNGSCVAQAPPPPYHRRCVWPCVRAHCTAASVIISISAHFTSVCRRNRLRAQTRPLGPHGTRLSGLQRTLRGHCVGLLWSGLLTDGWSS